MLQNSRVAKPLGRLLLIDYAGDHDLSAVRIAASIFIACASHYRLQDLRRLTAARSTGSASTSYGEERADKVIKVCKRRQKSVLTLCQ